MKRTKFPLNSETGPGVKGGKAFDEGFCTISIDEKDAAAPLMLGKGPERLVLLPADRSQL